ncbi:MAG: hypothetical protein WCG01_04860 [bacterium]
MNIFKKNFRITITLLIIALLIVLLIVHHFFDRDEEDKHDRSQRWPTKIDSSMQIGFIMNRFNLSKQDLESELQLNNLRWYKHYSLDSICEQQHLGCPAIVDDLNSMVSK